METMYKMHRPGIEGGQRVRQCKYIRQEQRLGSGSDNVNICIRQGQCVGRGSDNVNIFARDNVWPEGQTM